MTQLVFLGVAIVISLIGCGLLWLRHRKPRSMEAHMDAFSRELRALAPDDQSPEGRRRAG
ncbi:MAG: hypothetical protein JWO37_2332 [Acidimicrobiales bacterium]|nr:hypothetical protein [Acidimicrobiales bacterium]